MTRDPENLDRDTVADFGREWARFDQTGVGAPELAEMFRGYFAVFPWDALPPDAQGFDAGCGTGRWARFVAPRVGRLYCVDASAEALAVARRSLADLDNCRFHHAALDAMPMPDGSMDFGYSLGVLHHLPDPDSGLAACVRKLKPGAPLLVYVYYAFDNRALWYRLLWRASDGLRRLVSRLPFRLKAAITDPVAVLVYWPLARLAARLERLGIAVAALPLSAYRHRSLYSMRTDALDRFGTRLEHRYTAREIAAMMTRAGLVDLRFSPGVPYWCAVGRRAEPGAPAS